MRGEVDPQSSMFHYFSVESRIPADHPLRPMKKLADVALSAISADLDVLYAKSGLKSSNHLNCASHARWSSRKQ